MHRQTLEVLYSVFVTGMVGVAKTHVMPHIGPERGSPSIRTSCMVASFTGSPLAARSAAVLSPLPSLAAGCRGGAMLRHAVPCCRNLLSNIPHGGHGQPMPQPNLKHETTRIPEPHRDMRYHPYRRMDLTRALLTVLDQARGGRHRLSLRDPARTLEWPRSTAALLGRRGCLDRLQPPRRRHQRVAVGDV